MTFPVVFGKWYYTHTGDSIFFIKMIRLGPRIDKQTKKILLDNAILGEGFYFSSYNSAYCEYYPNGYSHWSSFSDDRSLLGDHWISNNTILKLAELLYKEKFIHKFNQKNNLKNFVRDILISELLRRS